MKDPEAAAAAQQAESAAGLTSPFASLSHHADAACSPSRSQSAVDAQSTAAAAAAAASVCPPTKKLSLTLPVSASGSELLLQPLPHSAFLLNPIRASSLHSGSRHSLTFKERLSVASDGPKRSSRTPITISTAASAASAAAADECCLSSSPASSPLAAASPSALSPERAASRTLPPMDSTSPSSSFQQRHAFSPSPSLPRGSNSAFRPSSLSFARSAPLSAVAVSLSHSGSPVAASSPHPSVSGSGDSSRGQHAGMEHSLTSNPSVSPTSAASQLFDTATPRADAGLDSHRLSLPAARYPTASPSSASLRPSTPSLSTRASSSYHFKSQPVRTQPSTLQAILKRTESASALPSLLLPDTRQQLRSASQPRLLPSSLPAPAASHRQQPSGDDAVDPVNAYHLFVCREAEEERQRRQQQLQHAMAAGARGRRRSSVLPVPAFTASGELEKGYLQQEHGKRRKQAVKALAALALVQAALLLPGPLAADAGPSLLWVGLAAASVVVLLLHSLCLHLLPAVCSNQLSFDRAILCTTTAAGAVAAVSQLQWADEADGLSSLYTLQSLIFIYFFAFCALRLSYRLAVVEAALLFSLYTALDLSSSLSSSLRLVLTCAAFHVCCLFVILRFCLLSQRLHHRYVANQHLLYQERKKDETLLRSMLPHQILQEYLEGRVGHVSAVATIGFIQVELGALGSRRCQSKGSFSNYEEAGTPVSRRLSAAASSPGGGLANGGSSSSDVAAELMARLHDTFKRIDAIVHLYQQRGVNKIETVSRTYLLCSGLLSDSDEHVAAMLDVCLEIHAMIAGRQASGARLPISLRVGIATGPVVGGIIGSERKFFRLFGDTVNVSARMSSAARPGEIMLTRAVLDGLDARQREMYSLDAGQLLQVKGKGEMECYRLLGARDEWRPAFSKASMMLQQRAAQTLAEQAAQALHKHSFVYHSLLQLTRLHPLRLTFCTPDTAIEPIFQHEHAALFSRHDRAVSAAVLLLALALLGLCISYGSTPVLVLAAVMVVAVLLQAALATPAWVVRRFQLWVGASVVLASGWATAVAAAETSEWPLPACLSLQLVLILSSLVAHLQFRFLLPLQLLGLAAFCAVWFSRPAFSSPGIAEVEPVLALLLTSAASLLVAYQVERRHRRNFLLAYAMEREQQQLAHFLSNLLPRFVFDVLHVRSAASSSARQIKQQIAAPQSSPLRTLPSRRSSTVAPSPSASVSSADAQVSVIPASPSSPAVIDSGTATRFAMRFPKATVFESDIEGYTAMVSSWSARDVLSMLNSLFSRFDSLARRCGVEKIDTVGDSFIVVAFEGRSDPVLDFALRVVQAMDDINAPIQAAAKAAADKADQSEDSREQKTAADDGEQRTEREGKVETKAEVPQGEAVEAEEKTTAEGETEPVGGEQRSETGEAPPASVAAAAPQRHPVSAFSYPLPPASFLRSPLSSPLSTSRSLLGRCASLKPFQLHLRMGIATGSAVGGVVGDQVPRFALFGQALDNAVAIEQAGRRDEVLVGRSTWEDARDRYDFLPTDVRAGEAETYRLMGKKPDGEMTKQQQQQQE